MCSTMDSTTGNVVEAERGNSMYKTKKIIALCLAFAILALSVVPVFATESEKNTKSVEQYTPYVPDGYTEEQWNSMSNEEQWDAFYAQGASNDIKSDEFGNYDTGSAQLLCMAETGVLNCSSLTLIFYNIDDGNYYWTDITDFDAPVITLPVGTYILDCVQYDGESSVNVKAELDPEQITITKNTTLDPDDGIFLWISVAYEEYQKNEIDTNIIAYSGFKGTVSLDLVGQSDVVSNEQEHTYHVILEDGKIYNRQVLYTGSYQLKNVQVTDSSGKVANAYYDGGEIYISRNTDAQASTTLYVYRTKADLPSAFIQSLSNPYNTYISTEDNAATLISDAADTEISEDNEKEDANATTESRSEEPSNNIGRLIFAVLVIIITVSFVLKNKEKILNIFKSFFN